MNSAHLITEHAKWELFLYPLFGPSFRHIRQRLKSISCQLKTNPYGGVLSQSVYVHPLPSNQAKKKWNVSRSEEQLSHEVWRPTSGVLPSFIRFFSEQWFCGCHCSQVDRWWGILIYCHVRVLVGWQAVFRHACIWLHLQGNHSRSFALYMGGHTLYSEIGILGKDV